jgi:TPR repeat protein
MFYTAYRCRNCARRSQHLTGGLLLGGALASMILLTFALGLAFGGIRGALAPGALRNAVSTPATGADEADPSNVRSPLGADLALAAAAEGGDVQAQLRLGLAYMKGNGVERDSAAGLKWIEQAAEQDYADAQYTLGTIHQSGRGALQNFPLAFKWYELAAQQNHAEAQYSLGMMYRAGQGIAIDKSKAYVWFNLAAAQGHERARDARDGMLSALTPEQVLAAQNAAREWRPTAAKK